MLLFLPNFILGVLNPHVLVCGFLLYSLFFLSIVMPFLHAFNASDYKWSPYASMVQLELLQVTNATNVDYAVRLLYHGQERRIPYCSASPCSLAEFSTYVKTIIPQDPVADCQVTKPEIMIGPRPPRLGRNQVLF